jgi:hypothetical protein
LSFWKPPTGLRKARPDDRLRGCPESILPVVFMDSGLARSLSSGGAERRPVGAPRNDGFGPITSAAAQTARVVYPDGLDPAHPSASGARNFRRKKPARKTKLLSRFNKSTRRANHAKPCPVPFAKIFRFTRRANHLYKFAPSRPTQRGVSRSSRTRDGVRWTRQRLARDGVAGQVERPVSDHQASGREMLQRTAKSCGPDAPTLASSSRSCVGPTGLRQDISAR